MHIQYTHIYYLCLAYLNSKKKKSPKTNTTPDISKQATWLILDNDTTTG